MKPPPYVVGILTPLRMHIWPNGHFHENLFSRIDTCQNVHFPKNLFSRTDTCQNVHLTKWTFSRKPIFQNKITLPRKSSLRKIIKMFIFFIFQIKSNQIFRYTRCSTPNRVTSLRGPSPRHCAWATQLLSKKCCSGGEPLATLCPI